MVRNVLILYYSQFGNTAKLASAIHRQTGADILRLQVSQGYFPDDMEEIDSLNLITRMVGFRRLSLSYQNCTTTIRF